MLESRWVWYPLCAPCLRDPRRKSWAGREGSKMGEFGARCPQEPRPGIWREKQMLGSRWVECLSCVPRPRQRSSSVP